MSRTKSNRLGDALVAFGRENRALDRQGVLDVIHGGTSADTIPMAGHGGYLVDIGTLRAGPIAGIDYTHAAIDCYIETGEKLLTMTFARQSLDALTGDVGVQLRYLFQLDRIPLSPCLNLIAEHDFLGSGRTVTTTLVTAPLLPVLDDRDTYGKLAAGIAAVLTERISATVNVPPPSPAPATTTSPSAAGSRFRSETGGRR